jgi:hypothetical protein
VTYSLKLHDPLSYNIAQMIGLVLGTLFRFWSYKKWVFLAPPTLQPVEDVEDVESQAGPLTTR